MANDSDELLTAALALTPTDRLRLVCALICTLPGGKVFSHITARRVSLNNSRAACDLIGSLPGAVAEDYGGDPEKGTVQRGVRAMMGGVAVDAYYVRRVRVTVEELDGEVV